MKSETKYYCETCWAAYPTAEQANACENSHKLCKCRKCQAVLLAHSVIGYGKALQGVLSFKHKKISVFIDDDDSTTHYNSVDIKYCPFCGREL